MREIRVYLRGPPATVPDRVATRHDTDVGSREPKTQHILMQRTSHQRAIPRDDVHARAPGNDKQRIRHLPKRPVEQLEITARQYADMQDDARIRAQSQLLASAPAVGRL